MEALQRYNRLVYKDFGNLIKAVFLIYDDLETYLVYST